MVKSLNYWSFPGGLADTLPIDECLRMASDYGYPAVELAIGQSGPLNVDTTEAEARDFRAAAEAYGIQIMSTASGLYWGRNLADADPAQREQAADDLKRMLQISSWLGAKTHLTIPGAVDVFFLPERPALPYAHVWQYATEGIRAALPVAERVGVKMGIENVWNRFLMSPYEMAKFIDQFDSDWVGAYVDVANCLQFGYPEDWLTYLGSRVTGVHFKDYRRAVGTADGFVSLLAGDVNWPAVMAALRAIGYSGPVAAEMIPGYAHCSEVLVAQTSLAMDAILEL